MIRYDLKCADGHAFEAWFASSSAFDEQSERGLVACAVCGGGGVEKALMAPGVPAKSNAGAASAPSEQPMISGPVPAEVESRLAALRKEIESKSDYVGDRFAAEARSIHVGDSEARSIYGEATREEAKALVDDGVPVAPLPFSTRRDD